MPSVSFDESMTTELLASLPKEMRAVFSATCAQRLLPCWQAYVAKAPPQADGSADIEAALRMLWSALERMAISKGELEALGNRVLESVPDEDQAWSVGEPYAEDAAAVVAYAIQAAFDESTDSARYAARRLYEVLDNCIANAQESPADKSSAYEPALCMAIENELARQERDLRELIAYSSSGVEGREGILQKLRLAAVEESKDFFQCGPYPGKERLS